jgi:hypothetical protein
MIFGFRILILDFLLWKYSHSSQLTANSYQLIANYIFHCRFKGLFLTKFQPFAKIRFIPANS